MVIKDTALLLFYLRKGLVDKLCKARKYPIMENDYVLDYMKDYILNSMTDYQLLEFVINGKITNKKSDLIREYFLLKNLGNICVNEINRFLSENDFKKELYEILNNMVPLSIYGLSSKFVDIKNKKFKNVKLSEIKRINAKIMNKAIKLMNDGYFKLEERKLYNHLIEQYRNPISKTSFPERHPVATAVLMTPLFGLVGGWVLRKIYHRYFSPAAERCKGLSFADRSRCLREARRRAFEEVVKYLQAQKPKCNMTKNPQKCREELDKKILSYRSKALLARDKFNQFLLY